MIIFFISQLVMDISCCHQTEHLEFCQDVSCNQARSKYKYTQITQIILLSFKITIIAK